MKEITDELIGQELLKAGSRTSWDRGDSCIDRDHLSTIWKAIIIMIGRLRQKTETVNAANKQAQMSPWRILRLWMEAMDYDTVDEYFIRYCRRLRMSAS